MGACVSAGEPGKLFAASALNLHDRSLSSGEQPCASQPLFSQPSSSCPARPRRAIRSPERSTASSAATAPLRRRCGDCRAIAAALGPQSTWYGTFGGKRLQANDRYNAYGTAACFESELDCRVWQQQAINYAPGPITFTSCRPGAPGRR